MTPPCLTPLEVEITRLLTQAAILAIQLDRERRHWFCQLFAALMAQEVLTAQHQAMTMRRGNGTK